MQSFRFILTCFLFLFEFALSEEDGDRQVLQYFSLHDLVPYNTFRRSNDLIQLDFKEIETLLWEILWTVHVESIVLEFLKLT